MRPTHASRPMGTFALPPHLRSQRGPARRSLAIVAAMTLMLSLGLTGCDNNGGNGAGNGGKSSTGNGKDGGDGKVTGPKIRYGALQAKVRGLDPMDIGDTTSASVANNFYEALYEYHYLKRPYEVVPLVAAAMPEYSEDRLTATIKLKKGVLFHDDECFPDGKGREVTAEDFIYSWKRVADIKTRSKNWWLLDGWIKGLNEFREASKNAKSKADVDYSTPVEGLKAIDSRTLQITLTRQVPDLVFRLAHTPTAVVPKEGVAKYGDGFRNYAVGTGPFILEEWRKGSKIVMARNPNYRDERYPSEGEEGDKEAGFLESAGKRLPLLDKIELSVILEDQPYWLSFERGKIDVAGIPKDNFGQVINENRDLNDEMKSKGIRLTKFQDPATYWLGFNMEDPVLGKNLPLRQAINLALNRKEYSHLFTNDRGIPAKSILPPMMPGYNKDINSPYTTFDQERAKAKVKEAVSVHGGPLPKLTLSMGGTDTTSRQSGEYYKRALEAIGLSIEVEYMTWPAVQDKIKNKSAQMYQMGWVADWPDPENFMLLFYGPNGSPGANNMNYKNPKFDELYEKIVKMQGSPERNKMIAEMEQMVIDDLPCLIMIHRVAFVLKHKWHRNYKPHVFGYGLSKYYDIDTSVRGH